VRVPAGSDEWAAAAAASLDVNGFCVLSSEDGAPPLVDTALCAECNVAASSRLEDLLRRVERRGVERSDDFRFAEIVHREGLRYDVPSGWNLEQEPGTGRFTAAAAAAAAAATIDQPSDAACFSRLHEAVDGVARTVLFTVRWHRAGHLQRLRAAREPHVEHRPD
jgi:hypothetical protein